ADLTDSCFFDDEWSSADCLNSAAPTSNPLSSLGLTFEQQLLFGATTAESSTSTTAVPSPTLPHKNHITKSSSSKSGAADASSTHIKNNGSTPPLSPTGSAMSSVAGSPQESSLSYPLDVSSSMAGRKRPAPGSQTNDDAHHSESSVKRHATEQNAATTAAAVAAAAVNTNDLAFPSSVLGLYDDDIIAAIASAADPLFMSSAAAAAAAAAGSSGANNSHVGMFGRKRSDSDSSCDSLTEAANAAVLAISSEDFDDDIHLPPSVIAAMAGAVAATAAAKAHGLMPRDDKPYRCPVPSCDKAYKNPNGLKYHNLHGHCNLAEDTRSSSSKPYRCRVPECYKAYKNLNGLKYHVQHAHCAMIPSLRDLSPNASPAEVAAAVAAAAAAAAVATSTPSSPTASPAQPSFMNFSSNASGTHSQNTVAPKQGGALPATMFPKVNSGVPARVIRAPGAPITSSAPATQQRPVPVSNGITGSARPVGSVSNHPASGAPPRMVHNSTSSVGSNPVPRMPQQQPQRLSSGNVAPVAQGSARPGPMMAAGPRRPMQQQQQQLVAGGNGGASVAGP
ncbi:Transcriptional regulator of ribosomal biogenesis proteins, partial [Coemansia sp. RSA 2603]